MHTNQRRAVVSFRKCLADVVAHIPTGTQIVVEHNKFETVPVCREGFTMHDFSAVDNHFSVSGKGGNPDSIIIDNQDSAHV